jgi:hypothetical protein
MKNILITVGVIVLIVLAFMWWRQRDNAPATTNTAVSGEAAEWKSFSDSARGVAFKYPEKLSTTYMSAQDWPPQVAIGNGPFKCTEAGTETDRAGKTEKTTINGRVYCVTAVTGAAAGSTYTEYAYETMKGDKLVILTFSIKSPQCANYDEPKRAECEAERASFNIDELVDKIVGTLELSEPTELYEKG